MLLIYGVGIPALFAILIFRNIRRIQYRDRMFMDRFGATCSLYKVRKWYYWEMIIFARKMGIILSRVIVTPIYQIVVGISVLFVCLLLQVFARPYMM